MRSVHMWKCDCGKRYKVICETEHPIGSPAGSLAVCECGRHIRVDGEIVEISYEVSEGVWQSIGAP